MKKKLLLVVAILLLVSLFSGFEEAQKVFDGAGLLSPSEIDELQAACIETAHNTQLDVVLLTTDDASGKSAMEYADDFYDENGFGYDVPQGDGVLCLIDMDNRKIWISTCGKGISMIDDYIIDVMLDNLYGDVVDGNYADAFRSFLYDVNHLKDIKEPYVSPGGTYSPPAPSNETTYYSDPVAFPHGLVIMISAFIAGIVVVVMVSTAGAQKGAAPNYINHSAVVIRGQSDVFTNKTVTVRHIPPPSDTGSGGGHSTTHTSSGGVSHGGGGRSF